MTGYIKLALKVLTRRKFFTFISLFGITVTLVVLIVATAILDDAFSPSGPEARFDRALVINRVIQEGKGSRMTVNPGYGFLTKYVLNLPGIERATAYSDAAQRTLYHGGARIDTRFKRTDANYWQVMQFRFLEGRPFTADEETRGAFVAVITDDLRRKLFGGEAAAGRAFELDGQRFQVIGVVPAVPQSRMAAYSDIWVPHTTSKSSEYRDAFIGSFRGAVLLKDAGDIERVQREFAAVVSRIPVTDPKEFEHVYATLDTPFQAFANDVTSGLRQFRKSATTVVRVALLILAILFMSLPALNLVTLNLSRILERASEIGVRKAFGAPRRSLVWQFVLENVILTVIGGLIAYGLANLVLVWINQTGVIPHAQYAPNFRVFVYGMLVAAFFGVFSGAYPAWRMSRLDPVTALRGGVA